MEELQACQPAKDTMAMKLRYSLRSLKHRTISQIQVFAMRLIRKTENSSNLVDHAKRELKIAGFYDEDSDYGGMLADAVTDLMYVFASQGHSGFSAHQTIRLFAKVANFEPLSPLTTNPEEWRQISIGIPPTKPQWQSKRNGKCFSYDGGQTWYNYEDCQYHVKTPSGAVYSSRRADLEPGEEIIKYPGCVECQLFKTCTDRRADQ